MQNFSENKTRSFEKIEFLHQFLHQFLLCVDVSAQVMLWSATHCSTTTSSTSICNLARRKLLGRFLVGIGRGRPTLELHACVCVTKVKTVGEPRIRDPRKCCFSITAAAFLLELCAKDAHYTTE